jgi:Uma2 family endonuclease
MATMLKLGPADHGRPMTLEEFDASGAEEGYKYELIEGKVYVSPQPNPPAGWVERWLFKKVDGYSDRHPEVINYVHYKTRVFVPREERHTNPEPDLAAYQVFPIDEPLTELQWEDVSPILVGEVVSEENPEKDLVRNVRLYREVPSIREYCIIDPRIDPVYPSMIVYRRQGTRWRKIEVEAGGTYTARLLPGFELILDTKR